MLNKQAIIYGLLVWLIPFAVGFLAFPLRTSDRPLFESIMAVALVLSVVFFAVRYFKNKSAQGLSTGIVWFAISVVLDLIFLVGFFQIPLVDYIKDIALTYLVIPIVTSAFAKR